MVLDLAAVRGLPAWAALVVEGARLLREAGWLAPSGGLADQCVKAEAPPRFECPAWECPPCVLTCPQLPLWGAGLALLFAAVGGAACHAACQRYGRQRTAPARRGGGVVA